MKSEENIVEYFGRFFYAGGRRDVFKRIVPLSLLVLQAVAAPLRSSVQDTLCQCAVPETVFGLEPGVDGCDLGAQRLVLSG